jgi:UDP-N-acetylglucosamine:LPS N-acetylglucosamine transferase
MKILYTVQRTSNGHIKTARETIPYIQKKGDLGILLSAIEPEIEFPFDVKYKFKGHYTVYLPSNAAIEIIKKWKKMEQIEWHVFSKQSTKNYKVHNISINSKLFLKRTALAEGIVSNAGFGTTSEALFLRKKLIVIPMKKQFEQHCNAVIFIEIGVTILKKINKKIIQPKLEWGNKNTLIEVKYYDYVKDTIDFIFKNHPVLIDNIPIDN